MGSISEVPGFALYLNQQVQSHNVFDYMLDRVGRAERMIVSSFAITEAYIRRIIRNRERIGRIELILDFTIASRNPRVTFFAERNVDGLYLVNNHSKIIFVESGNERMVAIMSNNATNNHRYESGIIIVDPAVTWAFLEQIEGLKEESFSYGKNRVNRED